jgi:hypothetical protein
MDDSMDDGQSALFESPEQGREKPKLRWYTLKDGKHISSRDLPNAEREEQLDAMRQWFHRHYEDPAESCPHDSGEGGYQYIYGGPYDASEELSTEFGGGVDDDLIGELASELDDISSEWSGDSNKFDADLDDYLFRSSAESLGQKDAFRQSALNIERLLEAKVEAADRQCMLRLLYVNVITALETYLSDKFISSINADEKLLRKFVETTPEFKKQNLPLSEVFNARENISSSVQEHLLEVVWHRLDKVQPMFRDTLGIMFPSDVKELHRAIILRHDCVHRNGKKKDGTERVLNESHVKGLLSEASKLVTWIESGGKEPEPPFSTGTSDISI